MVKAMADLKDGSNEFKSGENMKAGFDEANARYKEEARMKARGEEPTPQEGEKVYINANSPKTIHNKDIEKLYPSIKRARAGELVNKEVQTTTLQFENIDYSMATRYISKAAKSDEQVKEWGLAEFCPVRTFKMGKRPGMTGSEETDGKWTGGRLPTTDEEKRKILGRVFEIAVSFD